MFVVLLLVIAALIVTADQLVKNWAVETLQPVDSMDFIKIGDLKILDLTYLENDGAIFGSMAGQKWFLIGFTALIVVIGFVAMFWALKQSKFLGTAIMMFVAGGIGNLIDRVRYGYVVDMFEIKLFRFAIFNVADIFVTCAFVMVLFYVIFIDPKKQKAEKKAAENE